MRNHGPQLWVGVGVGALFGSREKAHFPSEKKKRNRFSSEVVYCVDKVLV